MTKRIRSRGGGNVDDLSRMESLDHVWKPSHFPLFSKRDCEEDGNFSREDSKCVQQETGGEYAGNRSSC